MSFYISGTVLYVERNKSWREASEREMWRCDAHIWYFERTLFLHPPAVVSLDALHYRNGELLPDRRGCVGQPRIRRLHGNICALSP
jgi:hypothetical protein